MVSSGRRATALLVLLLVAMAPLVAPALAQAPNPCNPPIATFTVPVSTFQAGGTERVTLVLTNPNSLAATAHVSASTPTGWTLTWDKNQTSVAATSSTQINGTLRAPAEGSGASQGTVTASAYLSCSQSPLPPSTKASKSATVQLAAAAFPWTYVLGAAVLLVAAALVFVYVRRQRATVELDCRQPMKDVAPGRGASFPLSVANRRGEPDTVRLHVLDVPEGWTAFVAVPEVELEAQESRDLWLMVRAPADAPRGATASVTIEAVPARGDRGDRVVVQANVVATEAEGPAS